MATDQPTHVRVDSAYLYRVHPLLVTSSVHPVTEVRKPRLGPVEYLVRGHWLSGYHVSPTNKGIQP